MIDRSHPLPLTRQAKALGISRGRVYYLPRPVPAADLAIMRRMDELHLEFPFAGGRMLRDLLTQEGIKIGRRHVSTLMKRMGLEALYRKPNTSKPAPGHKIYPYLLRGVSVDRPNQVWAMDITYVPMARGFVYLAAVVDWFSRRVLSWRLSITLEAAFCVEALEEALARHGRPEIFDTDQGSQGGFKWSSQHLDQGGCGGPSKAAFGSVPARRVAVPGPPLRGAAGGSAPVLGVDRGGTLERGRRSWRRRGAGSGDTLVPGGGRHATVTSLAVVEAAVRAPSVVCGAGGDRDLAGSRAWRARDRSPAGAGAVHDLPRAAPQRCRAWRRPGIQGHDRAMAR